LNRFLSSSSYFDSNVIVWISCSIFTMFSFANLTYLSFSSAFFSKS